MERTEMKRIEIQGEELLRREFEDLENEIVSYALVCRSPISDYLDVKSFINKKLPTSKLVYQRKSYGRLMIKTMKELEELNKGIE